MNETTAVMGLGEPQEATRWETIKDWLRTRARCVMGRFRTSRLLRAGALLCVIGAVFASGVVYSQRTTAPGKLCECPLKIETPAAGKGKNSAITTRGSK